MSEMEDLRQRIEALEKKIELEKEQRPKAYIRELARQFVNGNSDGSQRT